MGCILNYHHPTALCDFVYSALWSNLQMQQRLLPISNTKQMSSVPHED